MKKYFLRVFVGVVSLALILVACVPPVTDIPTLAETATPAGPSLTETITATPAVRSLTVCLGEEPNTLYPYGNLNASARSVLSAIYDGPIDVVEYGYEPIILEKIPNLDDGDAQVSPISVQAGDQVVDSTGSLVTLARGTRVRPSGCRSEDCTLTYDGSSAIQMDQLVVTFSMLEDLMWSDGEPITANDSVFSFQLASDPATPGSKFVVERTSIYEAADDYTLQWWGKPGFTDPDYGLNFWMPLPEHAWAEFPAADLPRLEISSHLPIGWGAYMIDEWEEGKQLHLVKNLNYFRAASGLPYFDELTFVFQPDADTALSALVDGTCDILDPSVRLDSHVGLLQKMEGDEQAQLLIAQTMNMEWLGLGIVPASYDNGFSARDDRPDFFGDKRMRQALTLCLDRQQVVDTVLFGLSQVPDVYLPADHPLHNGNIQTYTFNPEAGNQILEQIGWLDDDNDPTTPRRAANVTRVPVGTSLVLNYFTSSATQRHQVVDIFRQSLAQCGIGLNPIFMTADDFYAQGPSGPLFGRQFDLAAYSIGSNSLKPQCEWFTTAQIPAESNNWVGTNVTGYKNSQFDEACLTAAQTLPTDPEFSLHQEAQAIFAADLPSIPLYLRLKVAAARPDFCGFTLDPSSSSALSDIEIFDFGEGCVPR